MCVCVCKVSDINIYIYIYIYIYRERERDPVNRAVFKLRILNSFYSNLATYSSERENVFYTDRWNSSYNEESAILY